jgi:hypothetical protein
VEPRGVNPFPVSLIPLMRTKRRLTHKEPENGGTSQ